MLCFGFGQVWAEANVVFNETFDQCKGLGGNDGQWSGSVANSAFNTDYEGWVSEKAFGADKCAKFGTSSAKGSAETPDIDAEGASTGTLTFKAGAWIGDKTTLKLSFTNCDGDLSSVTMKNGEWTFYTVALSNISGSFKIKFELDATKGRFFLDEVVVSKGNTEGVTNTEVVEAPRKMIIDGQMFIFRGENKFDATGRLVQ